jgi:hypothetical protein
LNAQCSSQEIPLGSSNQIVKTNALELSMMFNLSPIFMRWSAPLSYKTNGPTISLGGGLFLYLFECNCTITFVRNHSHVSENNPRWRCPSNAVLLINCCWNSLDHGLSLPSVDLNMFVHWFIIWTPFFSSSWSKYCLFSFSGSTVLPQQLSFSKGVKKCWCHSC